jgi:Flp pilus assembly protein TadD
MRHTDTMYGAIIWLVASSKPLTFIAIICTTTSETAKRLRALGTICFQNGQLERAQYFFGEAARLNPSSLDALRLRGAVLMQLGGVLAEFGE